MRSSHFRAVIFDFGGVLCFPPTPEQIHEAARALELTAESFLQDFWRDRLEYDRGQDARDYWQAIAAKANRHLTSTEVQQFVNREIAFWSRFDTRILGWIQDLRNAGLRTGILSNLPRPLGEHLRGVPGFLNHFDHITFSYELNLVKPEPGIYRHALGGLGLDPADALFLDDKVENIRGASAVGLTAHLFTTWDEFVQLDLAGYGLPAPSS